MTVEELFEKMRRLKVTREELASRIGAYPHSLSNFKDGTFRMTEEDARWLSRICDEIVSERLTTHRRELAA